MSIHKDKPIALTCSLLSKACIPQKHGSSVLPSRSSSGLVLWPCSHVCPLSPQTVETTCAQIDQSIDRFIYPDIITYLPTADGRTPEPADSYFPHHHQLNFFNHPKRWRISSIHSIHLSTYPHIYRTVHLSAIYPSCINFICSYLIYLIYPLDIVNIELGGRGGPWPLWCGTSLTISWRGSPHII